MSLGNTCGLLPSRFDVTSFITAISTKIQTSWTMENMAQETKFKKSDLWDFCKKFQFLTKQMFLNTFSFVMSQHLLKWICMFVLEGVCDMILYYFLCKLSRFSRRQKRLTGGCGDCRKEWKMKMRKCKLC